MNIYDEAAMSILLEEMGDLVSGNIDLDTAVERMQSRLNLHLMEQVKQIPSPFEVWLDEENRIVSFHEIPDSRYYCAEEHDFWQMIVSLILNGYRVQ